MTVKQTYGSLHAPDGSYYVTLVDGNGNLAPASGSGAVTNTTFNATLTNDSVTSATGSSQTLLAANTTRKSLMIVNPSSNTTNWTIDPTGGVVVADTAPGFRLAPGDSYSPVIVPLNKITGISTASSTLVVLEGN